VSLKQDLDREFHTQTRLRLGKPGALDVYVDGRKIYSKGPGGRLPSSQEMFGLVRSLQS